MRLHPRGWGLFLCPLMNKSTFGTADYALATNNLNGRKIIKSFCGNSGLRLLLPLVFLGGDPINHQKMTILVVEPMKTPTVQEIDGSLESMQRIVGGDIEAVYPFDDPVVLVCHGEGKLLGLPMNRALTDESGVPYDIVCGTFFVVGIGDEDFTSLTEQQIEKYRKKYANEMVFSVPVPSGNHKNNAIRRKTNMKDKYVLTAESVTEGHPDKLCDTIADAVVDACLEHDPTAHVACEVMATAGKIIAAGEITAAWLPDIPAVICRTVREAGYGGSDYEVEVITREQSPDIAGAVNSGAETGAGDQGIVYGYACDETPELLPLPVVLVHELTRLLTQARKLRTIPGLKPDGKAQVSVEYQFGVPKRVSAVVVSCQHEDGVELAELRHAVMRHIIQPAFQDFPLDAETEILINPSGRFVEGGFEADTGLTGRKLMVDTYGGLAPHGGGALSGKDGTKVDRSGAYMARYIAKNIVAAGLAERCTVSLAYAIGKAKPVMVEVDAHGTGKYSDTALEQAIRTVCKLTPNGMIDTLGLDKPIFRKFCNYGHFTHADAPWERTDMTEVLESACHAKEMGGSAR